MDGPLVYVRLVRTLLEVLLHLGFGRANSMEHYTEEEVRQRPLWQPTQCFGRVDDPKRCKCHVSTQLEPPRLS